MSDPLVNALIILTPGLFQQTTVSHAVSGQLFFAYSRERWLAAKPYPSFMVRSDNRTFLIDHLFREPLQTSIPVVIECQDDSRFVAKIPDLNMAISGESVGDALSALREYVEMSFESFREECDSLGPEPARQLALLEKYVGKGAEYKPGDR